MVNIYHGNTDQKNHNSINSEDSKNTFNNKKKCGRNAETIILSSSEIAINALIWSGIAIYGSYRVYEQSKYTDVSNSRSFTDGWTFISNKRNTDDWEWETYRVFIFSFSFYFLLHALLSIVIQMTSTSKKVHFNILSTFSIAVLIYELGFNFVLGIVAMGVIYYVVAMVTGRMWCVWTANIGILAIFNSRTFSDPFIEFMTSAENEDSDLFQYKTTLVLFAVSLMANRLISFTGELVAGYSGMHHSNKVSRVPQENFQLIDLLTYMFYLPVIFSGPLMNYDEFVEQREVQRPLVSSKQVLSLVIRLLRIYGWMFAIDFTLHYVYFSNMIQDPALLSSVDKWTLIGVGFTQGQFFMVKYIGIFGIPCVLASIDGMEYPSGPKCISRIYKYSDTWKYIYRAVGGSKPGVLRRLSAACVSFLYIWFWHGGYTSLAWWSAINLVGVLAENLLNAASTAVVDLEERYVAVGWSRRIRALLAVPLLFLSTVAAIIFFSTTDNGFIFFRRLLDSGNWVISFINIYIQIFFWKMLHDPEAGNPYIAGPAIEGHADSIAITAVGLYCHVQTSMQFSQWERRRTHKLD